MLGSAPLWTPKSGPLLVISPHPDDETLGAGGLIRDWSRRGHQVVVVCVTDGEAAHAESRGLGRVRLQELQEALAVLSDLPIATLRLGLPDGRVAQYAPELAAVVGALVDARTTVIAPYEHDGHPDHDAVGKICRQVALAAGAPIARYPIWAWSHSTPGEFAAARWGRFAMDSRAQASKAEALACFVSQLIPYLNDPVVPTRETDYFARPYEAFLI